MVHGGGGDRLYALFNLGSFFVATESAEGGSLAGQCGDDDGVVRAVLLFQDGEEMPLARHGLVCLTQLIVDAAEHRQIRKSLGAIGTVERLVDFHGAEHECVVQDRKDPGQPLCHTPFPRP